MKHIKIRYVSNAIDINSNRVIEILRTLQEYKNKNLDYDSEILYDHIVYVFTKANTNKKWKDVVAGITPWGILKEAIKRSEPIKITKREKRSLGPIITKSALEVSLQKHLKNNSPARRSVRVSRRKFATSPHLS